MIYKLKIRYAVAGILLLTVWTVQFCSPLGGIYAQAVYPFVSRYLSSVSRLVPFAIGDLFIFLSITGIVFYPFYARLYRHLAWKRICGNEVEYLLWIYVWFYLAWGLNYSQKNFYERTGIPYTTYTSEVFRQFTDNYICQLNASYTPITAINKPLVASESRQGYEAISRTLGVHRPPHPHLQAKTMLFTPLASKVGVAGSMGPFFCEFTLNGDLPPSQYPATYAHELAHLLGISSEAEANFYAYQVCTRSDVQEICFSGYLSVLPHVLGNARQVLEPEAYTRLYNSIRPEVIELAKANQAHWAKKYSPLIGEIQNRIYDIYLKGNKIESGRKNYSEVIGLLISCQQAQEKGDFGQPKKSSSPSPTAQHDYQPEQVI